MNELLRKLLKLSVPKKIGVTLGVVALVALIDYLGANSPVAPPEDRIAGI